MKNIVTTVTGLAACLSALLAALTDFLAGALSLPEFGVALGVFAAGVGLVKAKDAKPTDPA